MRVNQKEIAMAGLVLAVFGFMMSAKHYTNVEKRFEKTPIQGNRYSLINGDTATRSEQYGAGLQGAFVTEAMEDALLTYYSQDTDRRADYDYTQMPLL